MRYVSPALARVLHESVRDAMLSACPDMRALTLTPELLARVHVIGAVARLRGRRARTAE